MKNVIIISENLCYVPNGMGLSDCFILTQATIHLGKVLAKFMSAGAFVNSNEKKKLLILSVCLYSDLWMMIAQLDVVGFHQLTYDIIGCKNNEE